MAWYPSSRRIDPSSPTTNLHRMQQHDDVILFCAMIVRRVSPPHPRSRSHPPPPRDSSSRPRWSPPAATATTTAAVRCSYDRHRTTPPSFVRYRSYVPSFSRCTRAPPPPRCRPAPHRRTTPSGGSRGSATPSSPPTPPHRSISSRSRFGSVPWCTPRSWRALPCSRISRGGSSARCRANCSRCTSDCVPA